MIMKTWIIIAIYWSVAVGATYCIRAYNNKKNHFKIAAFKALGITTTPSLWKRIGTQASIHCFSGTSVDACHHYRVPNRQILKTQ